MAPIIIYGMANSMATQRVTVVCEEKNIPYELSLVDILKGEHKKPVYLKEHPFGSIPYMDDNGFKLYESRAIARYLAAKFASQGPRLIPTEPEANALFEQAASVESANFEPYALGYAAEKNLKKRIFGIDGNEALAEEYKSKLESKLDAYDVILGKHKYLAGDEITLADLFHIGWGEFLVSIGFDGFEKRPNVARWWKDLSSRPSWKVVMAAHSAAEAVSSK